MTTQCTYSPLTASGSSTTRAPPEGADHANGGAMLAPLHVYCTGIGAPSGKAGLLIVNGPSAGAFGAVRPRVVTFGADDVVGWLLPWSPQPTGAPSSTSAPTAVALRRNVPSQVDSITNSLTLASAVGKVPISPRSGRRYLARFSTSSTRLRSPSVAVSIRLLAPFLTRNPGTGTTRSTVNSNRTFVESPSGVSVYRPSWARCCLELTRVQPTPSS